MTNQHHDATVNIEFRAMDDGTAELDIFDAIGPQFWGVTTSHVAAMLKQARGKAITVRINSPGGDANTGAAVYNLLKGHDAPVTVEVIGLAASAASIVAMGGSKIRMAENALMMIHDPWVQVAGDAADLREVADRLDKDAAALAKTYARRTGKSEEEVRQLMRDETWMTADEAVAEGFADETVEEMPVAACIREPHFAIFHHDLPERAKRFVELEQPESPLASGNHQPTDEDPRAGTIETSPGDSPSESRAHGPQRNDTMKINTAILQALALAEDADDATVLAAIKNMKAHAELGREVETITGQTGRGAVGAVRALKETAETHAELKLEVAEIQNSLHRRDFDAAIAEGLKGAKRKLTPAVAKHWGEKFDQAVATGRAKEVVDELRGFLAVAPTLAGSVIVQPEGGGGDGGLKWREKTFAELAPVERHQLKNDNPDLYTAMRQDAAAKGQL